MSDLIRMKIDLVKEDGTVIPLSSKAFELEAYGLYRGRADIFYEKLAEKCIEEAIDRIMEVGK